MVECSSSRILWRRWRHLWEVVKEAPVRGLPPTHIGIHSGPVIFQDGDIYGRTVNLAARLLALAGPDDVLVSAEVADSAREVAQFDSIGPGSK